MTSGPTVPSPSSLSNLIFVAGAGLGGLVGLAWSFRIARRAPATATGTDAIPVPGHRLGAQGLHGDLLTSRTPDVVDIRLRGSSGAAGLFRDYEVSFDRGRR